MTTSYPSPEELAYTPLLSELPGEVLEVLAERFETERFDTGHRFVVEGRAGYIFYVLHKGQVSVSQDGRKLRTLGPGDFFGEIAILGTGRRTATVTAVQPGEVWTLFGTSFRELQESRPDVASALQNAMTERLTTSPGQPSPP